MDLTQLANLGAFIGGVAVLVTLVYLAVQMRQANPYRDGVIGDAEWEEQYQVMLWYLAGPGIPVRGLSPSPCMARRSAIS